MKLSPSGLAVPFIPSRQQISTAPRHGYWSQYSSTPYGRRTFTSIPTREGELWDSNYCLFIKHLCLRVVLFLKANCVVHDASPYRTVSLYAQITRRHCLIFRRNHKTVAISFVMSVCPSVRAEKLYFHPMGFHEILSQGFLVKSGKNDSHYMKTEHNYYAALPFSWKYKKSFAKVRTEPKKEVTVSKSICYNTEETRSERERREGRHRSYFC